MVIFYSFLLVYHILWYVIYIYYQTVAVLFFKSQVFLDLLIHRPQEKPDPSDHKRAGARGHMFFLVRVPSVVTKVCPNDSGCCFGTMDFYDFFLFYDFLLIGNGIIIPSDEVIFLRGLVNHQPVIVIIRYYILWYMIIHFSPLYIPSMAVLSSPPIGCFCTPLFHVFIHGLSRFPRITGLASEIWAKWQPQLTWRWQSYGIAAM